MRTRIALAVAVSVALPAGAVGCKTQEDVADRTGKVIEEAKEEAAETRVDVEDKQEQLTTEQRDQESIASERAEFIAQTEQTLQHLDRQIEEARVEVRKQAAELRGEARLEMTQKLTDLENARAEAQAALDRFRAATAAQAGQIQQQTQTSLQRARSAYQDLRGRMSGADEDPDMRSPEPEPTEKQ